MIFDNIDNYRTYQFGSTWRMVFQFLQSINEDSEEKMYELSDGVVAYLVSYETKASDESKLEAHRKAVDVHVTISGQERVECFDTESLSVAEEYDESDDVEYYNYPGNAPAEVRVNQGYFAALWPTDAHVPSLMVGSKSVVKKIVFKIPVERLQSA